MVTNQFRRLMGAKAVGLVVVGDKANALSVGISNEHQCAIVVVPIVRIVDTLGFEMTSGLTIHENKIH
jgi:hypothetical protein